MSNMVEHAKREFLAMGYKPIEECDEDDPNKWMQESVLELLEVFGNQGHSGSSAPYCIDYFKRLASWEPLCPLQGTDDEWNKIGDGMFQNKRCSHVFKDADHAYDIEGKIFREPSGYCYRSTKSWVDVTFPYVPKQEYVDVEKDV